MTINLYLKDPKSGKETPVYFRIHYAGQKIKFNTGDRVNPADWNVKKQRHKRNGPLNLKLDSWEKWIQEAFIRYQTENKGYPNPESFRKLILANLRKLETDQSGAMTYFHFFEDHISRSEKGTRQPNNKPIAPATIQIYKRTLTTLKEFAQETGFKVDFDTLNSSFYFKFFDFLSAKGFLSNTIGKYLKFIKSVALEARDSGYLVSDYVLSRRFKVVKQEDTDQIYLTPDQIQELHLLDFKQNRTLDRVRDNFILQCLTAMRYSEVQTLSPKSIQGDLIRIQVQKTRTQLHVPIHPMVAQIIQKYEGGFPPAISNQKANDYLKEIGKMLPSLHDLFERKSFKRGKEIITQTPKWGLLCTHTGRRSFCTNAYLAKMPIQDIMRISGHKSEKIFRKYLRHEDLEHARIGYNPSSLYGWFLDQSGTQIVRLSMPRKDQAV